MTHRTAGESAQFLNCAINGDPNERLRGVANPEVAEPEDLIYVDSARHTRRAEDLPHDA